MLAQRSFLCKVSVCSFPSWLHWAFASVCSLALAMGHGLLTAGASLVAECGV